MKDIKLGFLHVSSPSTTWLRWSKRCLKEENLKRRHVEYSQCAKSPLVVFGIQSIDKAVS